MSGEEPRCPRCRALLGGATATDLVSEPKPGDFSACAYCSCILVFTEPPLVRRASNDDLAQLDKDERRELFKALAITRLAQKSGRVVPRV